MRGDSLSPRRSTAPTQKYPQALWVPPVYTFIPKSCHSMSKNGLYGLKRKRCAGKRHPKRAEAPELQPAQGDAASIPQPAALKTTTRRPGPRHVCLGSLSPAAPSAMLGTAAHPHPRHPPRGTDRSITEGSSLASAAGASPLVTACPPRRRARAAR